MLGHINTFDIPIEFVTLLLFINESEILSVLLTEIQVHAH